MWSGKNIWTFTAPLRSDFNSVQHSVKYKKGVRVWAWPSHTPGGSWCVKALRIEIYGDEFLSSIRLHVWNKKVSQQHFLEMLAALNRKKPLPAAPIDQSSIYIYIYSAPLAECQSLFGQWWERLLIFCGPFHKNSPGRSWWAGGDGIDLLI